jgi:spore germination protein KA
MGVGHLCSLRSFGVPYMTPLAPFIPVSNEDTLLRLPWWTMRRRPKLISDNKVRQSKHQKPKPPSSRGMINQEMEEDDQNET